MDVILDFGFGEFSRQRGGDPGRSLRGIDRDGRRCGDFVRSSLGVLEHVGLRHATQGPELQEDGGVLRMHRVDDGFPGGDLRRGPDSGNLFVAAGAGTDEGCFGDDEGSCRAGSLGVVFFGVGIGVVVGVGAEAGQRGHDEAVL